MAERERGALKRECARTRLHQPEGTWSEIWSRQAAAGAEEEGENHKAEAGAQAVAEPEAEARKGQGEGH